MLRLKLFYLEGLSHPLPPRHNLRVNNSNNNKKLNHRVTIYLAKKMMILTRVIFSEPRKNDDQKSQRNPDEVK